MKYVASYPIVSEIPTEKTPWPCTSTLGDLGPRTQHFWSNPHFVIVKCSD